MVSKVLAVSAVASTALAHASESMIGLCCVIGSACCGLACCA